MFKSILVPIDGSKLSFKALDMAAKLATAHSAKLTVLTATPDFPMIVGGEGYMIKPINAKQWGTATQRRSELIAEQVAKLLKEVPYTFTAVTSDRPYDAIIRVAKKRKCDLIVMASHGRRGLSALLLGSETTKVLTHTTIPVLVCR